MQKERRRAGRIEAEGKERRGVGGGGICATRNRTLGGYGFDLMSFITRKKLTISSVRVKKFCATTQFDAAKALTTGFKPPYTLGEGLARTLEFEFVHPRKDDIVFKSE